MQSLLFVAALVAVGACARPAATVPAIAPGACTGKLYLDVHNPLTLTIDVYEGDRTRRNEAKHIGSAPPGDTRLPIARPLVRMFALDVNGQGLTMEPTASTIRYQTVCIT